MIRFLVFFLVLPSLGFGQGINLKLLRPGPASGYVPYTEADKRQSYHNLDSLVASFGYLTSYTDTNNYPTSLSVSGTTTKTITIGRNGLSNLTASFTDLAGTGGDGNTFISLTGLGLDLEAGNTELYLDFEELPTDASPLSTSYFPYADGTTEKKLTFANLNSNIAPVWSNITSIPAGFLDGVDNEGGLVDGTGYDVSSNQFVYDFSELSSVDESVIFSGDYIPLRDISAGTTNRITFGNLADFMEDEMNGFFTDGTGYDVSSNQFVYDFSELTNKDENTLSSVDYFPIRDISTFTTDRMTLGNLADWMENNLTFPSGSDGNNYPTSFTTISNNVLTLNRFGLGSITTDLSPLKANWSLIFNMPADFSDGVDDEGDATISTGTYITTATEATNTYTSASARYIQTAADVIKLDDNRAGAFFTIRVHSGNAQINTTSGSIIIDGIGYTSGSYNQPAGTTHTYIRNDFNTQWVVIK